MVIFLAALKGIPAELYEAASIDGSGKWNQFLHITLPQISSVVFFNLIMQSIQALQNFTSAFVITGGGPMKRTYIIGMKLYDDAFRFYKVGYACAGVLDPVPGDSGADASGIQIVGRLGLLCG